MRSLSLYHVMSIFLLFSVISCGDLPVGKSMSNRSTYQKPLNFSPVANAGEDRSVVVGTVVVLDGSGSTDKNDDSLTYSWSIYSAPEGSTATFSSPSTVTTEFTPDVVGTYTIRLVVHDGTTIGIFDDVVIKATTNQPPPPPTNLSAYRSAPGDVLISWSNTSTEVAKFSLYRNGTYLGETLSAPYTDSGLTEGTKYCYAVTATGNNGKVSALSDEVCLTPSHFTFDHVWTYGLYGNTIGRNGMVSADIDSDGANEIIAGASIKIEDNQFWYILDYSAALNEYKIVSASPFYRSTITSISAFDIDGTGAYSIYVGLSDGTVHIYEASTMLHTNTLSPSNDPTRRILFADADNDSVSELVFCTPSEIVLYDPSTQTLESSIPHGADDCRAGNVDSDISNEIVLSDGQVVEYDGTTATVQWTYSGGEFGKFLELSDIDSDGMEEIIGAAAWYTIKAFDADVQSEKWQISTSTSIGALHMADVNSDGQAELFYSDRQGGSLYCYDTATQTLLWSIKDRDHGNQNISVSDTDGDGNIELLLSSGYAPFSHLDIYDLNSLTKEWRSYDISWPFSALAMGDVDDDGQTEIIFASEESTDFDYDDGTIIIVDAVTFEVEWQSPTNFFNLTSRIKINDLRIGDIDDDGQTEITIATVKSYYGMLYVINGSTHTIENSYIYDRYTPLYSLEIADVDNDGKTEVVAGSGHPNSGSPGRYVYIINGTTGTVEWKSPSIGPDPSFSVKPKISSLKISDIDNDGTMEIIALNDSIYIIDGITHAMEQSPLSGYSSIDIMDVDNDGTTEIIAGTKTGTISVLDPSFDTEFTYTYGSSPVNGVRFHDFDGDSSSELLFTSNGILHMYSPAASSILWQSEDMDATGKFEVVDIDNDGQTEIVVNSSFKTVVYTGPTN